MLQQQDTDHPVRLPKDIPQVVTTAFAPRQLHPGRQGHAAGRKEQATHPVRPFDAWTARIAIGTFGLVMVITLATTTLLELNDKQPSIALFLHLPLATLVTCLALRSPR